MAEHLVEAPGSGSQDSGQQSTKTSYTQSEIEAMTKADILALGTQLGYAMTTTEASTKEQIVADFMARQTAAQGD